MADYTIRPQDVYTAYPSTRGNLQHALGSRVTACFTFADSIDAHTLTLIALNSHSDWLPVSSTYAPTDDFYRISATDRKIYFSFTVAPKRIFTFVTQDNRTLHVQFSHFCDYFDNRQAAVILSADDWNMDPQHHAAFLAAAKACQERNLWITAAIVTDGISEAQWSEMVQAAGQGQVEIASHSCSHPGKKPYGENLRNELEGSKDLLLSRFSLSSIPCWIEPSGYLDPDIAQHLAHAGYLVSRNTQQGRNSFCSYTTYACYLRAGITHMLEEGTLDRANRLFDHCFKNGKIYHAAMHPRHLDWSADGWIYRHLDHISHRDAIWYTSLGTLYRYRFAVQHALSLKQGDSTVHAPAKRWKTHLATFCVNFRMLLDRIYICLRTRENT